MKNTNEIFDKRYLTKVAAYVLTAAFALGVMIFLGYHVIDRVSPGLELVDAVPTTVTEVMRVDGYVFRDEEPLYAGSASSGSVIAYVSNGGRVAVSDKLVDVYSGTSADVELRLAEIEDQINLLEKSKSENHSVQSTAGVESDIYDTVFAIRSHAENGEYADALSMRSTLLVNIKKRAILTGEITNYDIQIAELEAEKNRLRASLGACLETVKSSVSGYYFADYDGYGTVFSADLIDELTYEKFGELITCDPHYEGRLCIGAMVYGYEWYIVCTMSREESAGFTQGKNYAVDFPYSNVTLNMKVDRIVNALDGENSLVIFSSEKMPRDFDYTRMQPISISVKEYNGFKLPIEAVRVIGGYQGVYVKDEVTIVFKRVNIIYENDGYVICTGEKTDEDELYGWIKQNDIVVVGGTELYEGKVINK